MKIALVVGHRKGKQGAYGSVGLSEWRYNGILAVDLVEVAQQNGIDACVFFRDEMPGGYGERMNRLHERIDAWGADISISLHFNAAGRDDINGHEILYCSHRGRVIAEMLDSEFDRCLKNRDRNIKRRTRKQRGGGFLCRGKSVCILVEPFFAAHQHKFVKGTDGYADMLRAYGAFFDRLKGGRHAA